MDDTCRLHLRPRRAGGRPSPAGQDRLFRRVLSHPDDRPRSAGRGQRHAWRGSSSASPSDRRHADHSRLARPADPRQCDGRSLLGFCEGQPPADWRTEVTTSSTSATSITASPNRRWACRWTSARCRRAGRGVQVRAFRPPCRRSCSTSRLTRPVRQPRRRSGLFRATGRLCRQDARLAARLRRPDAHRYRATPNGLEVRAA